MCDLLFSLYSQYLAELGRSAITQKKYLNNLRLFKRWLTHENQGIDFTSVTQIDLLSYRNHLQLEKRHKTATINQHVAALTTEHDPTRMIAIAWKIDVQADRRWIRPAGLRWQLRRDRKGKKQKEHEAETSNGKPFHQVISPKNRERSAPPGSSRRMNASPTRKAWIPHRPMRSTSPEL